MEPVVELLAVSSLNSFCGSNSNLQDSDFSSHNIWSLLIWSVYHVGPEGWTKLSGDDVGELHYHYYPVAPATAEQVMEEAAAE